LSEHWGDSSLDGAAFTGDSGEGSSLESGGGSEEPFEGYPIEDEIDQNELVAVTGDEDPFQGYPIEDEMEPWGETLAQGKHLRGGSPATELPAGEQPADEQPADEQPADEQPADEQPADDSSETEGQQQSNVRGLSVENQDQSREQAWREQLTAAQLERQKTYDEEAADHAIKFESPDPLVPELARQIDAGRPGSVMYINRNIIDPATHLDRLTEYDIETDKAVIQVKSTADVEGMGKQLLRSASVSDKQVIGYAPLATPGRLAQLRAQGHQVFTDAPRLVTYLNSLREHSK
jgi:hypothetical protein